MRESAKTYFKLAPAMFQGAWTKYSALGNKWYVSKKSETGLKTFFGPLIMNF